MSLAKAFRTALLTAAVAGLAVVGTQAAQADDATAPTAPTRVTQPLPGTGEGDAAAPQAATPSPTASHNNDPWD
ncbi:hypothetical protein LG634_01525 [Streptomyces bambusae]|uniref:hypothetical protein n=1 Tax=Streptomyces bambusae TaxID=1550616 RepID=UPI001CFD712B|nr:hypothetical protein [Streptomyces bambusae]MCB5163530.1 hypothetical protein [Streptomyces bambusae]